MTFGVRFGLVDDTLILERLRANFAFYNAVHHDEIIPVVVQFEERVSLFDTDKIPYLIEAGAQALEQELPYLRQLLERAPA